MEYRLVTGPATEPLSLEEVKLYLRVDNTVENNLITALILAARQTVEDRCQRPLISQTWSANYDSNELNLNVKFINKAPLLSFTDVKYYDSEGDLQTLAASDYEVDLYGSPARFRLKTIPNVREGFNAMQATFVCGYANAASVPQPIKQAMYLIIGHLYENRQDVITGTQVHSIPNASAYLLEPYRNNFIFAPQI